MTTVHWKLEGMSCGHCVAAVQKALDRLPGIQRRQIEVGAAEIAFDPAQVDAGRIRAVIEGEGFAVREGGAA